MSVFVILQPRQHIEGSVTRLRTSRTIRHGMTCPSVSEIQETFSDWWPRECLAPGNLRKHQAGRIRRNIRNNVSFA